MGSYSFVPMHSFRTEFSNSGFIELLLFATFLSSAKRLDEFCVHTRFPLDRDDSHANRPCLGQGYLNIRLWSFPISPIFLLDASIRARLWFNRDVERIKMNSELASTLMS